MIKERIMLLISITVVFMLVLLVVFYIKVSSPWVILPTESSPHQLIVMDHGGSKVKKVTISHYEDETRICSHLLELKNPPSNQVPQTYLLPETEGSWCEVSIEFDHWYLSGQPTTTISLKYDNSDLMNKEGLLIYTKGDWSGGSERYGYMYVISGEEEKVYRSPMDSLEWSCIEDAPLPESKTLKDPMNYAPAYKGWQKDNQWVTSK